MKDIFNRKNRLRLWVILFVIGTSLISSCSKEKDTPPSKSHKIIFKATVSDGSTISNTVYGVDTDITTQSSLSGESWASDEIIAPAGSINANVSIQALGQDADATLTVQIYVDGELKKEGKSMGEILVAQANYRF
ncbi:hypothetical protein [Arachidicoccus terrestris]|uniref:hypothetical protein n=1 Tax=Arachidicoccus terrestris TaxID=2875539 RepID=UPI001CC54360|nr:hypothetical protein [Arachidicoccus terrestris]UAY55528.1 hypothetical protein K9M52_00375 [Arachidicoccus terrestris]